MKRYTSPQGRSAWHYKPDECRRVNEPERYVDRDKAYVEYHELEPCPVCHPHLKPAGENPKNTCRDTLANRAWGKTD